MESVTAFHFFSLAGIALGLACVMWVANTPAFSCFMGLLAGGIAALGLHYASAVELQVIEGWLTTYHFPILAGIPLVVFLTEILRRKVEDWL